jgi:hypothetical protein
MAIKQVAKGVYEFVNKTTKTAKNYVRKAADATIGKAMDATLEQISGVAKDKKFIESEQYKKMIGDHPDMAQGYYDQYAKKMSKIYGKDWEEEEKKKKRK